MATHGAGTMADPPEGCEVIGKIVTVNPAKREARARVASALTLEVSAMVWVWFLRGDAWARLRVAKAGAAEGELRLEFAPGVPMDTVRALQGQFVAVEKATIVSRGPLWKRVRAMLDLPAETADGARVGTVVEVIEGPKTGVIKVESDNGTQWLVPVVTGAVEALDEVRGTVVLGDYRAYAIEVEDEED